MFRFVIRGWKMCRKSGEGCREMGLFVFGVGLLEMGDSTIN